MGRGRLQQVTQPQWLRCCYVQLDCSRHRALSEQQRMLSPILNLQPSLGGTRLMACRPRSTSHAVLPVYSP